VSRRDRIFERKQVYSSRSMARGTTPGTDTSTKWPWYPTRPFVRVSKELRITDLIVEYDPAIEVHIHIRMLANPSDFTISRRRIHNTRFITANTKCHARLRDNFSQVWPQPPPVRQPPHCVRHIHWWISRVVRLRTVSSLPFAYG
jgi:hypothetical protein